MTKPVIRTSDRRQFKKCRTAWNFGSKIRMDWEPDRTSEPLHFGLAYHAGMEAFYDPLLWKHDKDLALIAAIAAFRHEYTYIGPEDDTPSIQDWSDKANLGAAMLTNYAKWSHELDNFKMITREHEFEVPIKVPVGFDLPNHGPFDMDSEGNLTIWSEIHRAYLPVVYQGRIDGLMQDDNGYWIWDDKTAGKLMPTEWLENEDQIGSYCWAFSQMGLDIRGFVYQEHLKGIPHKPKLLKSSKLSTDKSQNTTLELYLETLDEHGQSPLDYEEFLTFLRENPREYFRRTQLHKSPKQLEIIGQRIFFEALDMLGNPHIYPNPTPMNCGQCAYFAPCTAAQDGADYEWILESNFHRRTPVK